MPGIFISYRRQQGEASAGRLYESLAKRLPNIRIFVDFDSLKAGDDFVERIDEALRSPQVVLVIIGPHWMTAADEAGNRRLSDESDPVRYEVGKALKNGLTVIPILVDGATVPAEDQLPGDLKPLARRQAAELRHASWGADVDRLANRIEPLLRQRRRGRLSRIFPEARIGRGGSAVQAAGLLAALVLTGLGVFAVAKYVRAAPQREVEAILDQIRYENTEEKSVSAIRALRDVVVKRQDRQITDRAVARLKKIVMTKDDETSHGRAIRKVALETIKVLRGYDLTADFHNGELEKADLVAVDLSRTNLKGVDLSGAFLLSCSFSGSDLSGANLAGAFVRNGDYAGVQLRGAILDDVDWFNAGGFAEKILREVPIDHLMSCPADRAHVHSTRAFEEEFENNYVYSLQDIGPDRGQMAGFWSTYAKSGGLCDLVDTWKRQQL